ncbi:MAG: von Willebrand factor type A domain-containing protein [Akkermansiaceae bacterium]
MNDDLHTYIEPELQARIAALVLGEASEFERDELEKLIAEKPELAVYQRRIQAMHDLLGDTVKPTKDPGWQLSTEKREKLRQTFATKGVSISSATGRQTGGTVRVQIRSAVAIAACVLITVILFSMATPVILKQTSQRENVSLAEDSMHHGMESDEKAAADDMIWDSVHSAPDSVSRRTAKKPSAPSSSMSKVIAANTTSPSAVPVPEPASTPNPSVEFGNGDDFADGWGGNKNGSVSGSGGGGGGGYEVADEEADPFASSDIAKENVRKIAIDGKKKTVDRVTRRELSSKALEDLAETQKSENKIIINGKTNAPKGGFSKDLGGLQQAGDTIDETDQRSTATKEAQLGVTREDNRGGSAPMFEHSEIDGTSNVSDTSSIEGVATASLRSGDQAVNRDSTLALLNNQNRSGGSSDDDSFLTSGRGVDRELAPDEQSPTNMTRNLAGVQDARVKEVEGLLPDAVAAPPVAAEQAKTVNEVRKNLYTGEGYYNLGDYDKAAAEIKKVLQKDPYNKAARSWLEKVEETKSDYYRAAYDQTRSKLLAEVDSAWEIVVPPAPEVRAEASRSVAKPEPPQKSAPTNAKLARIQEELKKKSDKVAETRSKLMAAAEKTGVIWAESERGGQTIGGELELRQLAEKQLYETERERDQLKTQIDKLLAVNDEDLPSLAAELPEVGFKEAHSKYEKTKTELLTLKASGLSGKHPDVVAREAEVAKLKKGLEKRAVNVRESLRHRLGIIEGRVQKMREVRDKKQDEGTDRARTVKEFNKLRKEYETAQGIKDQMQIKYDIEKTKLGIPTTNQQAAPIKPSARPKPLPDETLTSAEPFSTFSLNVNDVSFKLARVALLEKGKWPDAAKVRTEEFVNAFDYGDPSPSQSEKVSCAIEQSAHPFLQQRNLLRIGMKTAAMGRSQPLRLTVLLDNSGSMEREDREASVLAAMQVLAAQLNPQDVITVVSFARQPRLVADRVPGNQAAKLVDLVAKIPSEGGTNLEEALRLAGTLAKRQHTEGAQSRVVLITDGVANLGNTVPEQLSNEVETMRQQGIAFDACGVGAEGLNDDILEALTRKGDGRYYFLNRPEDADAGFAKQLAGALTPAAKNVKVQVVFNPKRVARYRLLGFEKHRLNKEDFRNDKVDAAEMAAEEAGNAVYQIQVNPQGEGELGEVYVRFLDASTGRMVERSWPLAYQPQAKPFDLAEPSMQLAGTAAMLGEKLHGTDAGSVRFSMISETLGKIKAHYASDTKVQDLIRMCRKVE